MKLCATCGKEINNIKKYCSKCSLDLYDERHRIYMRLHYQKRKKGGEKDGKESKGDGKGGMGGSPLPL